MKNCLAVLSLLFIFSCSKNTVDQSLITEENSAILLYDTIAIDSFSAGATSVDVARKIRMSSQKFQDSLMQVKLKNAEEQLLKKEKDEKLNLEKKAAEALKKKEAEIIKAKEKSQNVSPTTEPTGNL